MCPSAISRPDQISSQRFVKFVHSDGHLKAVEGIAHDKLGIYLITSSRNSLGVRLLGAREEQELDAGGSLKAGQAEMRRLERLNSGSGCRTLAWRGRWRRHRVKRAGDGVDAVEGSGEDQVIVAVQLLEARRKAAIVD